MRYSVILALGVVACSRPAAGDVSDRASTVAAPTDAATARAELEKIQKDWGTALMARDTAFFARVWADDLTMSGPDGAPLADRAASLKEISDTTMGVRDIRVDDLKIRLYDDNKVGVVTGIARAMFKQGKQHVPASIAYTETFVNRDGRWQAVAGHYSMLPK